MPLVEMLVEAPALSEAPLVPEDVSVGGFKVVAGRRLEPGSEQEITIRISDVTFEGCRVRVKGCRESGVNTGSWAISVELMLSEEERERFALALEDLSERQRSKGPG